MKSLVKFRWFTLTLSLLVFADCKSQKQMDAFFLPNVHNDSPVILDTNPTEGLIGFSSSKEVWVLFDREMDQQKTEDAFRLSSDQSTAEGAFRWEFNRVYFQPRLPLTNGLPYTMLVGSASESAAGVDLGKDTTIHFHSGTDIDRPHFVSSTPAANATGVDPGISIRLSFSEPMSYASIAGGITISPSFSYSISMQNGGQDIVFVPSNPLANGTYQVTYTSTLTDVAGNPLSNEGTFLFIVGSDFIPPALLSVTSGAVTLAENLLTTGVEKNSAIVLRFSEPMNRTAVEDALSLSPSQASTKAWNAAGDQLTITFLPSLDSETNYTLTLSSSATDLAGNALTRTYSYPFLTNGASSTRPQVIEVRQFDSSAPLVSSGTICNDGAAQLPPSGVALTSLQPFDTSKTIDMNGSAGAFACVLQFRFVFNNKMIRSTLVSATTAPSFIIRPDETLGAVNDPAIYDLQLDPADHRIMILSITGDFPPHIVGEATPILLFRIRGGSDGALDINGNSMAEDYNLYLTY